jgi:predicted alpha/beta-hydrolase family hydrolase
LCFSVASARPAGAQQGRELLGAGVPRLVLQGERDRFGSPAEVRAAAAADPSVRIVAIPDADHSMRTPKTAATSAADVAELITDAVAACCLPHPAGTAAAAERCPHHDEQRDQ